MTKLWTHTTSLMYSRKYRILIM